MMFERFTAEARTVVVHAQEHARRLGHRYIGCEHLLLALAYGDQPVAAALRDCGASPQRVEEEIVHRAGLGAGAGLFADLDADALAAIGIDLDAVRARIESSFGAGVLTAAGQAAQQAGRRRWRHRLRRWRQRRRVRRTGVGQPAAPAPAGLYQAAADRPAGHIPFTPGAKRSLQYTVREAQARRDPAIRPEYVALGVLTVGNGLVPQVLAALGTSAPQVRAAILDRCRQAG